MHPGIVVRWLRRAIWIIILAGCALFAFALLKPPPQDLPWTPLRIDQPVGSFNGRKLVQLDRRPSACFDLLKETGIRFRQIPTHGKNECEVNDAVHLAPGQAMLSLVPASVAPSCPVMAGLLVWQWQVVQPAAQRIFGVSVTQIDHCGS